MVWVFCTRRYPLVSGEVSDWPVKEGHVKLVDGLGVRHGEGAGSPTVEASVKRQDGQLGGSWKLEREHSEMDRVILMEVVLFGVPISD